MTTIADCLQGPHRRPPSDRTTALVLMAAITAACVIGLAIGCTADKEAKIIETDERIGGPIASLFTGEQGSQAATALPGGWTLAWLPPGATLDWCLLEHEHTHHEQQARDGVVVFYARWKVELLACLPRDDRTARECYRAISYEVEAYEVQGHCERGTR